MSGNWLISILVKHGVRSALNCPHLTSSVQMLKHWTQSCIATEPLCWTVQCTAAVRSDTRCIWNDLQHATPTKSDAEMRPRHSELRVSYTETADTCSPYRERQRGGGRQGGRHREKFLADSLSSFFPALMVGPIFSVQLN